MDSQILHKKIELIQWLSTLEDNTILEKLLKFRKEETKDWWNSISEAEKQSIENGIIDAENGKISPHSEARKIYEKWL